MKKLLFSLSLVSVALVHAQFTVNISAPKELRGSAVLYTLDGSKNIIASTSPKKGDAWLFSVKKPYSGMMRVFFPETGEAVNFISENSNVSIALDYSNSKIKDVQYLDESNKLMSSLQDVQQKKELILPALTQIATYYKKNNEFTGALEKEISRLSQKNSVQNLDSHPYIKYYITNYSKFLEKNAEGKTTSSRDEIASFLSNSNEYLESSSLLRPILMEYLNAGTNATIPAAVDGLLEKVNVETPRGQNILSELIDIFDSYDMQDMKNKYFNQAKNLKCTINQRLTSTIQQIKNVEIGAQFPNYNFKNVTGTTAKSLYDVKADKKIVVFWSSTCSHCEAELPKLLEKYAVLKSQNIQVVGLSVDADKSSYTERIKAFPWINDSELLGWNSSIVDTYNIHATPTYFILDSKNKIVAKPDHVEDVLKFFNLK